MGNAHSHQLLEHGMTDETAQEAKQKPRTPKKPQRAELVNTDKRNGKIGQIARPLEKDAPAWLGKGWQRKSAGSAD